ncbi:MAG: hypothetical protein M0R66_06675 [Candidatus Omnitrophica bacterium]|nr:hypothetical protein [Candidatus Omnitrophota bacterium]
MKDLIFKNLTSADRKRRVISTSEVADSQGIRSIVRRHFVYMIKEAHAGRIQEPGSQVYVIKERNTRDKIESFFCRVKGHMYINNSEKLFLLYFSHSLKIKLAVIPENAEVGLNKGL